MSNLTKTENLLLDIKFTEYGRDKFLTEGVNIIKYFSIGDSDTDYTSIHNLDGRDIPFYRGNNLIFNVKDIKNKVLFNEFDAFKEVDRFSNELLRETIPTIHKTSLSFLKLKINDRSSKYYNLLKSLNYDEILKRDENTEFFKDGLKNSIFSTLKNTNEVLIIKIDGDINNAIDGKHIKLKLKDHTLFSTISSDNKINNLDQIIKDDNNIIGNNISLLFSDVLTPNKNNVSWGAGFLSQKAFGVLNKQTYDATSLNNNVINHDITCGYVLLDKGYVVITNQEIIDMFSTNDTFIPMEDSYTEFMSNTIDIFKLITFSCGRGEFFKTTNDTFVAGEEIQITEVGLYDANKKLILYTKTNGFVSKLIHEQITFSFRMRV